MGDSETWTTDPAGAAHEDLGGKSIGEQIDRAIGDFEARLLRLKEELNRKRAEIKEIERLIAGMEKEQAKAVRELLQANPRVRRLLSSMAKSKSNERRKRGAAGPIEPLDSESIL